MRGKNVSGSRDRAVPLCFNKHGISHRIPCSKDTSQTALSTCVAGTGQRRQLAFPTAAPRSCSLQQCLDLLDLRGLRGHGCATPGRDRDRPARAVPPVAQRTGSLTDFLCWRGLLLAVHRDDAPQLPGRSRTGKVLLAECIRKRSVSLEAGKHSHQLKAEL